MLPEKGLPPEGPWIMGGRTRQERRRIQTPHCHERGQLLGTERGVFAVRTERALWMVGPGQVLWIPAGVLHEARSHGAFAGWSLYVRRESGDAPFLSSATPLFTALARRLTGPDWSTHHARIAELLWAEFLLLPSATLSLPWPSHPGLRRVTERLHDAPEDRRDQKDWATLAALSPRGFVRHFRAETGLSFSAWRQRARVLAAQARLAGGESVTQAAYAVGYDSLGAFAAAFRAATGYSPRAWVARSVSR
ncbi:helix-turn-helix transcriptional regulator [Acidomonas methanolica]|uniref:Transcriptional regulator AraC n=2 Tax=Acidomonas methanolica TaxID=437 RepID=A0A023D7Z9_ACIMT|nr:helix-turn-helix transcriptional regulator [Acidomonas methanolica]TCS23786.1 AraC family transcriptional regulator [Acidomonas methanolica]GAJ29870.1 transcriptional regulator AraC [Acidomonas methanolica NBRC 104435]GEL00219.1 transcriptional regulator [Acidomonas methanolica NBRC 104435]